MAMSRPNLELVETTSDRITILADFPNLKPAPLFDYWTNPDLLTKLWPPAVELEPRLCGTNHFSWPKQDWHLRGRFIMFDRGKTLAFTWKWDHEPIDETRVTVLFQSIPDMGTRLTLHPRSILEKLRGEKDTGRTRRRLDLLLRKLQEQA